MRILKKSSNLEKPHKIYLIGKGISKSKSPQIQNAIYEYLGLDWHYELMDTNNLDLSNIEVCNITYPFKQVCNNSNLYIAPDNFYNFDGLGAYKFLEMNNVDMSKTVILGTGVTAKEIAKYTRGKMLGREAESMDDATLVIDATPVNRAKDFLDFYDGKQTFMDVKYYNNFDYSAYFKTCYDGKGMLVAQAVLSIQEICKHYNKKCDTFNTLFDIGMKEIL